MDAVGTDQDVSRDPAAVLEPGLDAIAVALETGEAMAEVNPFGREARGDDRQQIGAMNGDVRRAAELLAQRIERRLLQGAPVLPAALVGEERAHALAVEALGEAQSAQDARRVRAHIDAAADLGEFGGLLVDIDLEAGLTQRQRRREPTDAAADHRDPEGCAVHRDLTAVIAPVSAAVGGLEPRQERGSWRR